MDGMLERARVALDGRTESTTGRGTDILDNMRVLVATAAIGVVALASSQAQAQGILGGIMGALSGQPTQMNVSPRSFLGQQGGYPSPYGQPVQYGQAYGQPYGQPGPYGYANQGSGLNPADVPYASRAAHRAMATPVGEPSPWNNPQTGNQGFYLPVRLGVYEGGAPVREIEVSVTKLGQQTMTETITMIENRSGGWQTLPNQDLGGVTFYEPQQAPQYPSRGW